MDITPDTKDWTWVLERPCPECGLDSSTIAPGSVAALIRANVSDWQEPLRSPSASARPAPPVWSTVEYACHVRDVYLLFDQRLALMLSEDDPLFANWNQDDTALAHRYSEQDAAEVASALAAAGEQIAVRFDTVTADQWGRTGRRSDGAAFTIESFARYFIHDIVHHIYDVTSPSKQPAG